MTRRLVAVALVLAVLGGLLALGYFPQGFLRPLAEARLSKALGGRVAIERLHVAPWRLRVDIGGLLVEVRGLEVRVAQLRLEALPEALRGSVALRSLEVRGVDVKLRPTPRAAPAPAAATSLPPVRIERLTLAGARVRYADPALGGDVVADGIEADGSVGSGPLDIRVAALRIERQPAPPVVSARARLEIDPELHARVSQAEVASARSTLRASGALGPLAAPSPDLRFEADIDAGEAAGAADIGEARGALRLSGRLHGADAEWKAEVAAPSLTAAGIAISALRGSASGQGASATAKLELAALGGRIAAEARLAGEALDARVEAMGLQAEALGQLAGAPPALRGAVSGSVVLHGPRARLDTVLVAEGPELTLYGTPLSVRAEARGSVAPEAGSVQLSWTARADALPDLSLAGARVVGARLDASGTASGTGLPTVTARADGRVDLAGSPGRAVPFEIAYSGRGSDVASASLRVPETPLESAVPEAAGFVSLVADGRGPVSRLDGSARFEARDLAWRGVAIGSLRLAADGRAGDWTVSGEAPAHALRLDARSPVPGRGPRRIAGVLTLHESAVAALAPLLPPDVPQDGRVSGALSFEGPIGDPQALALVADLRLVGTGYEAHVEGKTAAAPRAPIELHVTGRADVAAVERVEASELAGELSLDVRVGGSVEAPTATGELRLREGRLTGGSLPEVRIGEAVLAFDGPGAELRPTVLELADGRITAAGRATLSPSLPTQLHIEWTGLLAEKLLAAVGAAGDAAGLRGRLSGAADIAGEGRTLRAWRGSASVAADGLRAGELPIGLSPLSLRLDDGVLELAPVTLRAGAGGLDVQGRVDLARRTLDVQGRGAFDLRALSPLLGTAALTGQAELDLALGGSFDAPAPRGSLVVRDGAARARDIPEALTGIEARLTFDADAWRIDEARAILGGGTLTASGGGRLAGTSLADVRVEIRGREMALRYPVGLKSRIEADLVLASAADGFLLRGDVRALRGLYDLDLAIEQSVRAPVLAPEPSPLLRSIGLDIRVVLESPVLIRNRLATLDVDGSLQFRGDLETPAPFGRLEIARGGKIFLSGRDFPVETGRLSYSGDWDPRVDLRAKRRLVEQTDVGERPHDVELIAEGPLSTVQPVLRAEGLSDGQVLSLVTTGSTAGATGRAIGAQVAGQQAANLVLGQVSQGLGFDEVPVQPELLARETDPAARFTFGKQLAPMLSLVYSLSLKGPEQRFIQVQARLGHGISVTGQRTDDGLLAAAVGQVVRFGGGPKAKPAEERIRLSAVRVEGELPDEARSAHGLRAGQRIAPWDLLEAADRIRRRLNEMGYVEAQAGARFVEHAAEIRVNAGPRFDWKVTGMEAPPDLTDVVRQALYEEDALDRGRARLLEVLRKRGHLRARVVSTGTDSAPGRRTLAFAVEPGPLLEADVDFPGAQLLSPDRLLAAAGGAAPLLVEPDEAARRLVQAYAAANRFGAKVGSVTLDESPGKVGIRVPVDEGPAPRVAAVEFESATLPHEELQRVASLAVGSPYSPASIATAIERIRNHCYRQGYAQAGVTAENLVRGVDVAVRLRVREGARLVVGSVEIVGLRRTRESLVRRQIRLKPGDPVDPRELAGTERRLLDLGTFAQVLVSASGSPTTLRIELVERERIEAAYDVRWSQEQGPAGQVDGEARNLLGLGLNLGGRYRLGADDREARASLVMPFLRRGRLTVAAYETQEDFEATDIFTGEPFTNTVTERVIEFQQSRRMRRHTTLLAGYRFKSVFSTAFPSPIHVASLDLSGVRETRDNPLDARRGHLAALNLQLSPKALGSELTFVKGFAQLFLHRPLSGALTWSQGLSLGLAHGFGGQVIIPSERFLAGGSNSLRGFEQDSVGPLDILGEPAGGEAVLILNEELRYRHASGFGFALFWDAGNVFEKASDLSLDLRHDLGAGLRWVSPIGLLRLDLAFPLARREGEDSYQLFFNLGQVF